MSDTCPTVKPKLKIKGVLKGVSDSAAIATGVSDLVKSWLGSNLEAARGDPELLLELCRKIEESTKSMKGKQRPDKKEIVLLVLQELFPTITEPELVQASGLIEFYCLYRLVDKKGLLARAVKAVSRFFW